MTSNDDPSTSAGMGPSDDTTIVPPPTAAAPALAWSLDGPDDVATDRRRAPWLRPVLSIGVLAAVALVAILGWVLLRGAPVPTGPAAPTVRSTSSAPTVPTPTKTADLSPTPAPATVDDDPGLDPNDRAFLQALRRDEIIIPDQSKAVPGARWVCSKLRAGSTRTDVVDIFKRANPEISDLGAVDFVAAAAVFYCPEYA